MQKRFPRSDLHSHANELKQQKALKSLFVRMTNSDTWEEAAVKYPNHATQEQLQRFIGIDIKKTTPKSFSDFCQRAINTCTATSDSDQQSLSIVVKGVKAFVVFSEHLKFTGIIIKR